MQLDSIKEKKKQTNKRKDILTIETFWELQTHIYYDIFTIRFWQIGQFWFWFLAQTSKHTYSPYIYATNYNIFYCRHLLNMDIALLYTQTQFLQTRPRRYWGLADEVVECFQTEKRRREDPKECTHTRVFLVAIWRPGLIMGVVIFYSGCLVWTIWKKNE